MEHYTNFKRVALATIEQKAVRHRPHRVIYEPSFADTETSHYNRGTPKDEDYLTWVYLWGISVGNTIYYGRKPSEMMDFINTLIKVYDLGDVNKMTIYIHNLPYDISYLYDYVAKYIDDNAVMLASSPQHPFNIETNKGILFKCTYRLSQRSLDKWGKDLNTTHRKKTDIGKSYSVIINQEETLNATEVEYFEADIWTLKECFYKEITRRGYTFADVPLTKTGFVRDLFKKAYKSQINNRRYFTKTRVDKYQYQRLLDASFGGMTGVSCEHIGTKVESEGGIGHYDFDSHYPTQMECKKMPMHPRTIYDYRRGIGKAPSDDTLQWYINNGYYYVIEILILGAKIKKGVSLPFMSRSKLRKTQHKGKIYDINGKVTRIDGGHYLLTCTCFDFIIYREQYDLDYRIVSVDTYSAERLPSYVLDTVETLYKDKTDLKKRVGELESRKASRSKIEDAKQDLLLCKGDLNGVFGCCYTRPVREELKYNAYTHKWSVEMPEPEEALDKYYNKWSSCLAYQWGVFICALARFELYTVISKVIGYNAFLYADTDSCFFIWSQDIEDRLKEYNSRCVKDSEVNGYFVTLEDGSKKLFHKFDAESDNKKSKTFKSLHCKCYALEPEGKLSITVAGVTKTYRNNKEMYREDELGSIDNLKDGFKFVECGGTRASYSYVPMGIYDTPYGAIETCGGCVILDATKTLSEADGDNLFIEYYLGE